MSVPVYNTKGEETGKVDLPDVLFGIEWNGDLVHQVLLAQSANRRQVSAHTKDRGEVSGGGKKPWRQKGTGRARHGSNRSPIWIGGGVTFGPRSDRNYKKAINRKMRRKALFAALSAKLRDDEVLIVDDIEPGEGKTKQLKEMLIGLPCSGMSTLIVLPDMNMPLIRAANNIPKVSTMQASDLNVYDIANVKYLLVLRSSIDKIQETFLS